MDVRLSGYEDHLAFWVALDDMKDRHENPSPFSVFHGSGWVILQLGHLEHLGSMQT